MITGLTTGIQVTSEGPHYPSLRRLPRMLTYHRESVKIQSSEDIISVFCLRDKMEAREILKMKPMMYIHVNSYVTSFTGTPFINNSCQKYFQ